MLLLPVAPVFALMVVLVAVEPSLDTAVGLAGAALVLVLFAVLAYTGLRIARRNVDPFVKITAAAGTVWLVGQAVINIWYVVGLLPVTGIPLPMISAGGTSLIITMVV